MLCCIYTALLKETCNSQLHRLLGNTWGLYVYFGLQISVITHLNSSRLKNNPACTSNPMFKAAIPAVIILYCLLHSNITVNPPNLT